jgi:hypothetical protein
LRASAQAKQHRIEDIEDLISFGGTFAEIVSRSGYKNWETLSKALRASDRQDLLRALRLKRIGDGAPTGLPPVKRKPVCRKRDCGRKKYAKGYCLRHYDRLRYAGTPVMADIKRPVCSIAECGKPHHSHGYCDRHARQRSRGKL